MTQSVEAVTDAVKRSLLGIALLALVVMALGVAAGRADRATDREPDPPARRRRRRGRGRRPRSARGGRGVERAALAGAQLQRDDRARGPDALQSAGVRCRRLASAAHAAHRAAPATRGARDRVPPTNATSVKAAMHEVDRLAAIVDELLILSRAGESGGQGEAVSLGGRRRPRRGSLAQGSGGRPTRDRPQVGRSIGRRRSACRPTSTGLSMR